MRTGVARWAVVVLCTLIAAVLGAVLANALAPHDVRYRSTANVAILPAPDLSMADASAFWEVLTRGQVNRTAAIVYGESAAWLPSAAAVAGVAQRDLTLTATAVPESTMVEVSIEAPSAAAADAALRDVLNSAGPKVTAVTVPFVVNVLGPQDGASTPLTGLSQTQIVAAGATAGAALGLGVGWLISRNRFRRPDPLGPDPS